MSNYLRGWETINCLMSNCLRGWEAAETFTLKVSLASELGSGRSVEAFSSPLTAMVIKPPRFLELKKQENFRFCPVAERAREKGRMKNGGAQL